MNYRNNPAELTLSIEIVSWCPMQFLWVSKPHQCFWTPGFRLKLHPILSFTLRIWRNEDRNVHRCVWSCWQLFDFFFHFVNKSWVFYIINIYLGQKKYRFNKKCKGNFDSSNLNAYPYFFQIPSDLSLRWNWHFSLSSLLPVSHLEKFSQHFVMCWLPSPSLMYFCGILLAHQTSIILHF